MFKRTTAINKILKMKARYRVVQGGSSAGKTYAIMAVLIDWAIKNPGKKIDVVSQTYDHLKDGAIQDFKDIMAVTNRWNDNGWHDTAHKYTFSNKSFIRFKSIDKESKAKGPRRDVLYVNEANHIEYPIFNQLAIRTNAFIFADFNPDKKFWVHDEIINQPDSDFIILTYKDNEALNDNIIADFAKKREQAKTSSYWDNWCRVYIDGEIGKLDGIVFSNWTTIDSIPKEASLIGAGMDFGFTNDPSTLVAVYKYNDKIILDEIIYQKGLTNSQLTSLIRQNAMDKTLIWADSAEPKSIYELNSYGIQIAPVAKGADSINFGINILQNYEMLITQRSVNLRKELENYTWMKDTNGNPTNKPMDINNHAIDAVRYLAMMMLRSNITNKIRIIK